MMENPYSLNFGAIPSRLISREQQISEIVDIFSSDTPSSNAFIITGVRGSGKTVTMSTIVSRFKDKKDWITVSLNPVRDLLSALAANLSENPRLKASFVKAEFGFSAGINISMHSEGPADIEVQLKKMLFAIKKSKKRVLIAIDEVIKSDNFKVFASSFQMLLYEGYPVFLIMTGLYDNIRSLQNEKSLTFLYRTPKFELKPLSVIAMSDNYRDVFNITESESLEMARFTMGYSYAFQVLGYLKYKDNKPLKELVQEFDETMEEYAYEKIWSELSSRDREVVMLLASNGRMRVKDIIEKTGMTSGSFSTYRRRLGKGGIISIKEYGYCELCLPRFREIVNAWNNEFT